MTEFKRGIVNVPKPPARTVPPYRPLKVTSKPTEPPKTITRPAQKPMPA